MYIHSVNLPSFCWGGRGLSLLPYFLNGGLDRISVFRGELLGKMGVNFFRGGCGFYIKSKLKSEIFNDKKVYK